MPKTFMGHGSKAEGFRAQVNMSLSFVHVRGIKTYPFIFDEHEQIPTDVELYDSILFPLLFSNLITLVYISKPPCVWVFVSNLGMDISMSMDPSSIDQMWHN